MGKDNFQIVSDHEPKDKKNKKIIIGACIAMLLIACVAGVYSIISHKNSKPADYGTYEEKAKIYDDQGIKYSYDDYKKDEKAIEEAKNNFKEGEESLAIEQGGISNATKQLLSQNDQVLEDMKEDTQVDTTANDVAKSIVSQTKDMNTFISNHCGYPDSEYGDDEYWVAKKLIDDICDSMSGKATFEPLYGMSVGQTQAEVRYSILENIQYNIGNGYTQYNNCINNWMAMGHPTISSIDTISLVPAENKMFDDTYLNNLDAIIVSNGVGYKVSLASQVEDGGNAFFKVLDVRKY